jgi:hypothetical protein
VYGKQGDLGPISSGMTDIANVFVPKVVMRTAEELEKVGTTSLITRHNIGELESLTRGVTGLNISTTTNRTAFARAVLKFSRIEQRGDALRRSYSDNEERLRKLTVEMHEQRSPEQYQQLFKEARKLVKEIESGTVLIGGRKHKVGLTDKQAAERVISMVSRNLFQEIERIPTEFLPTAAHELEFSVLKRGNEKLMDHVWRQMTLPYLQSKTDFTELGTAAAKALQLSDSTINPTVKARLAQAYQHLVVRMTQLRINGRTEGGRALLRKKLGEFPRWVQTRMAESAGLLLR